MIVALDVLYREADDRAVAAAAAFPDWTAPEPADTWTQAIHGITPYEPGQFYRRELPCLVPLVETAARSHDIDTLVVDGFVDLGDRGPGLGRHLYHAFGGAFEVVGVAKTPFAGNPGIAVRRGGSTRPLWITSTGDIDLAVANVRSMAGDHRIPDLLAWVDRLTRGGG